MARFVALTRCGMDPLVSSYDRPILINAEVVSALERHSEDINATVLWTGSHHVIVRGSPETIAAKLGRA